TANALDLDIACNDGRGGPATLSGSASDPGGLGGTTGGTGGTGGAGTGGSGGGVGGPVRQDCLEVRGGPNCSCDIGHTTESLAWLVLVLAAVAIRRGRRCGSGK